MKISIVICTYNKAKWLNSVLMNLNNQTLDRSLFEVCLIIDGSTDSTVEMLKKIHLNYNFKYIEINKAGLTYARNVGIEASKGDYILFCDDDVIYADNFLSELILSIYKSPSSVHIGNIENISIKNSLNIIESINTLGNYNYELLETGKSEHIFFDAIKVLYKYPESSKNVIWWTIVTGGNLCIPIKCLKEAGNFDTDITGWGPEDADLCFRIFKKGFNAVYNNQCRLYHLDHERDGKNISQLMMKNICHIYKKSEKAIAISLYLRFMSGLISMRAFNNEYASLLNIEKIDLPDFYINLTDYTIVQIPTYTKNKI